MDYSLLVEVERSDVSHYHKRFPNRILDPVSCSMKDRLGYIAMILILLPLIIVEKSWRNLTIVCRGKLAVLGSDGRIYHFGIIDFLQR